MRVQSWKAILEAKDDIDGLIAQAMLPEVRNHASPLGRQDATIAGALPPAGHSSDAVTMIAGPGAPRPADPGSALPETIGVPIAPATMILQPAPRPVEAKIPGSEAVTMIAGPGALALAAPVMAGPSGGGLPDGLIAGVSAPASPSSEALTMIGKAGKVGVAPGKPVAAAADTAATVHLYWQVRQRIYRLRTALQGEPSADSLMLPLVIFCDERILRHLDGSTRRSWPFLQKQWLDGCNGGQEFFRIAEEVLGNASSPIEICEVLYFCLVNRFVGQFADSPQVIGQFEQRLRARIVPSRTLLSPRKTSPVKPPAPRRPVVYSYLAAATLLVLLVAGLIAFSNLV